MPLYTNGLIFFKLIISIQLNALIISYRIYSKSWFAIGYKTYGCDSYQWHTILSIIISINSQNW